MCDNHSRRRLYALIVMGLATTLLLAYSYSAHAIQGEAACTDVMTNLERAIANCTTINDNYVCFGSYAAEGRPFQNRFSRPKDQRPLSQFDTINTLDEDGAVLMRLAAQGTSDPVTILLFGPVELVSEAGGNGLTLRVADTDDPLCRNTEPGMMARVRTGQRASVVVNGIVIELGSTALITLESAETMAVTNVEGEVAVASDVGDAVIPPGFQSLTNIETGEIEEPEPSPLVESEVVDFLAFDRRGLARVTNLNDTVLSCTGVINFNQTVRDRIYTVDQECLYEFCADEGSVVTIKASAVDGELDPWLDLRLSTDALLYYNDDAALRAQNAMICNERLPADGCYTIVVRSYHNESNGAFDLSLRGETDCEQPPTFCEVLPRRGLNLRSEPNLESNVLRTMVQGSGVQVIGTSQGAQWLEVRHLATDSSGWVLNGERLIECPVLTPTPTPNPSLTPPTITPTKTPTNGKPKPTDPPKPVPKPLPPTKQSPFGDP